MAISLSNSCGKKPIPGPREVGLITWWKLGSSTYNALYGGVWGMERYYMANNSLCGHFRNALLSWLLGQLLKQPS